MPQILSSHSVIPTYCTWNIPFHPWSVR